MRRNLTKHEKLAMLVKQDFKCGCSCGKPVSLENGHGEHSLPVGLGNESKPDAIWRDDCHLDKSRTDLMMIRKADRMGLFHCTGRSSTAKVKKIQSRGFDKTYMRGFDGTVRAKDR